MDLHDCFVAIRRELKTALFAHKKYRAWHYALNLNNSHHATSLATYLKLKDAQYKEVMEISGLAKYMVINKTNTFCINRNECEIFLASIGMDPHDGNNYFDKQQVTDVEKKKCYWLCLVDVSKTKEKRSALDIKIQSNIWSSGGGIFRKNGLKLQ